MVALDHSTYRHVKGECHSVENAAGGDVFRYGVYYIVIVRLFCDNNIGAFVKPCYCRNVIDQVDKSVGICACFCYKLLAGLLWQIVVVGQYVEVSFDDTDGRFDFVVDVVGKLALC